MKSFFSISISALLLIGLSTSSAFAQSTSSASSTGSLIETVVENVTDLKETITEPKAPEVNQSDTVLKPATQKRIVNLAANISNRFDAVIWRFENIAARLQKRIDTETAAGKDTAAAQTSLNAATTALADAKYRMQGIDAVVFAAVTSKNPKEDWQAVKERYQSTREVIKTAYQELKNTISNLKSAGQAPTETETSTSTPTT